MVDQATERQVRDLLVKLERRGETVATAESCTGGLVATWLTHLPGSSTVYMGGVSAYANATKTRLLGVDVAMLDRHGAVSAAVAEAMARGARDALGTDYAVSITGVAGPGGGSAEKPVGTVFCGVASAAGVRSVAWQLSGDRTAIRETAAQRALAELFRDIPD